MMRLVLLAQGAAATATEAAQPAGSLVAYRLARLEKFDDPRLLWTGVAIAAAVIALFVAWQYRREASALRPGLAVALAGLRLVAFAGAIVFFLDPLKRIDQQVVTQSRVAVLVDASQSMAVKDEATAGADGSVTRSESVVRTLEDSPFLESLRREHDVTLAVFDADVRRVARWTRGAGATGDRTEEAEKTSATTSDNARDQRSRLSEEMAPLGAETRLGDALASQAVLGDKSGGTLAGVFIFSDGGQNAGADPLQLAESAAEAKAQLVTIGVGSTEPRRNLRVQELIAPARAYPRDKITIRALVQGEGYAGRTVEAELYVRQGGPEGAETQIGREAISFEGDTETVPVEFELEPTEVGRLDLEVRLAAPADDQYPDDNRRSAETEVVETSTRVLLVASGATRDYRYLRNQLRRDEHATVDVLLQLSPPNISQDADKILTNFPTSKEELFEYDAIVAFDPDWTQLDALQVELLEQWVAEEAGGLIMVAGPVHTAAWVQSPEHAKIRALYPVEFQRRLTLLDDGLFGSKTPWPIELTREGEEADFLWIGDTAGESRERWERFPGVYGCYAVKGPKPGAQVYGRYSDPDAGISAERPVYFAEHFYGAGRVFYMGSGEMWRLRTLDPGYFETLYTQLVRHVSEGRLLRGSSLGRLLVERDRYYPGDTVVVRAQLSTASREPFVAPRVTARVTGADGVGRNVDLAADENRPGNFAGQFSVSKEGSYRIELPVPDAADEQLAKRITVTAPDLEFDETRRNEELLMALAHRTGGRYYETTELAMRGASGVPAAASLIESRAVTKIVRGKPDQDFSERINQWLLGVICGALSVEWLLRRLFKLA